MSGCESGWWATARGKNALSIGLNRVGGLLHNGGKFCTAERTEAGDDTAGVSRLTSISRLATSPTGPKAKVTPQRPPISFHETKHSHRQTEGHQARASPFCIHLPKEKRHPAPAKSRVLCRPRHQLSSPEHRKSYQQQTGSQSKYQPTDTLNFYRASPLNLLSKYWHAAYITDKHLAPNPRTAQLPVLPAVSLQF